MWKPWANLIIWALGEREEAERRKRGKREQRWEEGEQREGRRCLWKAIQSCAVPKGWFLILEPIHKKNQGTEHTLSGGWSFQSWETGSTWGYQGSACQRKKRGRSLWLVKLSFPDQGEQNCRDGESLTFSIAWPRDRLWGAPVPAFLRPAFSKDSSREHAGSKGPISSGGDRDTAPQCHPQQPGECL